MNHLANPSVPRVILLATDLTYRCDRALERATLIAQTWNARLVLLTVIDPAEAAAMRKRWVAVPSWRKRRDLRQIAEHQLRMAAPPGDVNVSLRVEEGPVLDTILRVAAEEKSELIVTGVGRKETLGHMLFGSTVDGLVRRTTLPILVVRNRARAPYRSVMVPSDFSRASRGALETAARFFPHSQLSLFHAYDVPYASGFGTDLARDRLDYRDRAVGESAAFLAESSLPAQTRSRVRVVVDHGPPSLLLKEYSQDRDVDLIALHTNGRSKIVDVLIGGIAKLILDEATTDVLVTRSQPTDVTLASRRATPENPRLLRKLLPPRSAGASL
jgi:nucleotide-binding universal stress UspA family protein